MTFVNFDNEVNKMVKEIINIPGILDKYRTYSMYEKSVEEFKKILISKIKSCLKECVDNNGPNYVEKMKYGDWGFTGYNSQVAFDVSDFDKSRFRDELYKIRAFARDAIYLMTLILSANSTSEYDKIKNEYEEELPDFIVEFYEQNRIPYDRKRTSFEDLQEVVALSSMPALAFYNSYLHIDCAQYVELIQEYQKNTQGISLETLSQKINAAKTDVEARKDAIKKYRSNKIFRYYTK